MILAFDASVAHRQSIIEIEMKLRSNRFRKDTIVINHFHRTLSSDTVYSGLSVLMKGERYTNNLRYF
jgi:hypothetical protein